MSAITPRYNCSQDVLYAIAILAVDNCEDHLLAFTDFSESYDADYIAAFRAAIEAAQALPDEHTRASEHQIMRIALQGLGTTATDKWLALKRYIEKAYTDPATQHVRLNEAGHSDYDKAAHENWGKLKAMLLAGQSFITTHSVELLANNNMPAGFPATYDAALTAYTDKYAAFLAEEETAHEATPIKITANNGLYDMLTPMNADGQFIFKNDFEVKRQFTFEHQKQLVTPAGAAGVDVTVVSGATFLPVAEANVTMQQPEKPATLLNTDANGQCSFNSMAVGKYTMTVTKDGFTTQVINVTISTGVQSRRKVTMSSAPLAE